jgi:hypothetical protein
MKLERVGIGIATYNRRDLLQENITRVRQHTRYANLELIVADDGSSDGTLEMLRQRDVPVVTGVNMGVAWNKNRALYLLAQVRRCEVVILLEDDTMPDRAGWEQDWIDAGRRWGHVNLAGHWLTKSFRHGAGTSEDPIMSGNVTAQCAAYSREALDWAGYFDSRFRGYGHEHVEHSHRLGRCGYGGTHRTVDGKHEVLYMLIKGSVEVRPAKSTMNPEQVARNLEVAHQIMTEQTYRAPWRDLAELRQFRAEIMSALEARPRGFGMRGPAEALATAPHKPLSRLRRLLSRRT